MSDPNLPLEGIRVVELGVWVAGPAAGAMLADWGADVIKVEPPSGDPQRGVFRALGLKEGRVPPFEQDNRGKRSLVLDLTDPANEATMMALLESADVLITNMRPSALENLGLDSERIRARFPRLIYGRLTGYGAEGPDANRAGYDVGAFWSRAGVPTRIVPPDEPPPNIPPGFGDHMTAVALVAGIMAALFQRERSGEGQLVDTSLLRTGIYGLSADFLMQMHFGKLQPRTKREETAAPLVNCYRTADDKWVWLLAVESTRHWPKLLAALGREDLGEKEEFADATARYHNRRTLIPELDAAMRTLPRAELTRRFDEHDVWWAPVQTVDEVLEDPQAQAAGAFISIEGSGDDDPIGGVATPVSFGGQTSSLQAAAPALGEHTEQIIASLLEKASEKKAS